MFTILQKVVFKRGVRFKNLSVQHNVFTVNISFDVSLNDGVFVSNDPVNFVDPEGLIVVSTAIYVGYVYGPAIIAAGTVAAYKLAPYMPAILDFAAGFLPGPPRTPLGVGGFVTGKGIESMIDSITGAVEDYKPNDCP